MDFSSYCQGKNTWVLGENAQVPSDWSRQTGTRDFPPQGITGWAMATSHDECLWLAPCGHALIELYSGALDVSNKQFFFFYNNRFPLEVCFDGNLFVERLNFILVS